MVLDHLVVARYLLEQGADRDKTDRCDRTPLHHAVYNGHLETAKLLMVYGADLNVRGSRGQLPRRRLDHGHKRATEQDRHSNAATSASAQQEENEEEEQSDKKPRHDRGERGGEDGRGRRG